MTGTVRDISGLPAGGLYVKAYPAEQFPLFQMFVIRLIDRFFTQYAKQLAAREAAL